MTEMLQAPLSGTDLTRYNALKHGVLSRHKVLPWEDAKSFNALLNALVAEHLPQGPTEAHLVDEIAGVIWRKQRLQLAEAAAYKRGLKDTMVSYSVTAKSALAHRPGAPGTSVESAITSTEGEIQAELHDDEADQAMTEKALGILRAGRRGAYDRALAALRGDTREWWTRTVEDNDNANNQRYRADAASLLAFLESEVLPWHEQRRQELDSYPIVRDQAYGEALDTDRLEKLARYEVHLDRKLERMLAMLVRLKDLRRSEPGPNSVSQK